MPTQAEVNEAIEAMGSLVSAAGGEGDESLDVLKDALGEVTARPLANFDVGLLNDAAALLFDEAHGRGARAGELKAQREAMKYTQQQNLELVEQMLGTALSCEDAGERWRMARYATLLLSRTPGSAGVEYGRILAKLKRGVPSSGEPDAGLIREAQAAVAELRAA